MILLLDIGNTHTHLGLFQNGRIKRQANIETRGWFGRAAARQVGEFLKGHSIEGAALCSVVPKATEPVRRFLSTRCPVPPVELGPNTLTGVGIDYPKPSTIGPDRLANAIAVYHQFGAPSVVVDFGTAVTFDVVDKAANYVGGVIAPGLAAMTDYLHEKTALLPRIQIREVEAAIGRNTEQAMLIGAVHGYRGLIREIVAQLKRELKTPRLPVVATGGYARLMASTMPEITAVNPLLTLEGLGHVWKAHGEKRTLAKKAPHRKGSRSPKELS